MNDEYIPASKRPRKYLDNIDDLQKHIEEHIEALGGAFEMPKAEKLVKSMAMEAELYVVRDLLYGEYDDISLHYEDGCIEVWISIRGELLVISEPIKISELVKEYDDQPNDDKAGIFQHIKKWSEPY